MEQYYKYDKNNNNLYIEPVIDDYNKDNPMPDDVTDVRPDDGLYEARYIVEERRWIETGAPPEVVFEPLEPTILERLEACEATLRALEVEKPIEFYAVQTRLGNIEIGDVPVKMKESVSAEIERVGENS
ncbi:MAG: hypothetical protein FWD48_01265 [Oscillospiraceae bacterium]|nr:hypothetical protein [Oscillospiraceae bacterium]